MSTRSKYASAVFVASSKNINSLKAGDTNVKVNGTIIALNKGNLYYKACPPDAKKIDHKEKE